MGSAMVALVTLGTAVAISNFKRLPYGPEGARNIIADFAPTIAVGVGVVFAQWLAGNYGFNFEALSLPASLAPTANRPWIADLAAVPNNIKLMSALAAPACAILLYMDQNITTRLVNNSAGLQEACCLPP